MTWNPITKAAPHRVAIRMHPVIMTALAAGPSCHPAITVSVRPHLMLMPNPPRFWMPNARVVVAFGSGENQGKMQIIAAKDGDYRIGHFPRRQNNNSGTLRITLKHRTDLRKQPMQPVDWSAGDEWLQIVLPAWFGEREE